jgi:molybdopterin synthase catalytic subunit
LIRTQITEEPILPQSALDQVASPQCGAALLFLGVVRDHHGGREVVGLEYEAYREMAEGILSVIGREAAKRFGVGNIAVIHRVGRLQVGDVSLAIAVASPHRAEAYEASRFVIESVKARLPVWKKEHYGSGGPEWVQGTDPSKTDGGAEGGP